MIEGAKMLSAVFITEQLTTQRDMRISFNAWKDGHVLMDVYSNGITINVHMTIQDLIEVQDRINKVLLNPTT
jgi:hypothetical protein